MEIKSLILGLLFSVGVFAMKSGAGLGYQMKKQRGLGRLTTLLSFLASYALVFWLAWFLVITVDFVTQLDKVMLFFKNGMTLHFLLAGLLLIWGVTLLKSRQKEHSHAWLLLALPCPVCFSVIVFSGGFLHSLWPENQYIFPALATVFSSIALVSAFIVVFFIRGCAEQSLGAVMLLAALYFLITLAVVPQFGDIERIYRLSKTSVTVLTDPKLPLFFTGLGLAFAAGFLLSLRKEGSWT